MALNTREMWSNGIKIASFSKKLRKIAQRLGALSPNPHNLRRLGAPPPDPCLWYVWITVHFFTQALLSISTFSHFNYWFKPSPLKEFLVTCQHEASTASDLPFYDILAPTKNSSFEVSDESLHVICGLGPPPQSKILATPMPGNIKLLLIITHIFNFF